MLTGLLHVPLVTRRRVMVSGAWGGGRVEESTLQTDSEHQQEFHVDAVKLAAFTGRPARPASAQRSEYSSVLARSRSFARASLVAEEPSNRAHVSGTRLRS
jgi:hypothetical protein